jgi:hypothetical protein
MPYSRKLLSHKESGVAAIATRIDSALLPAGDSPRTTLASRKLGGERMRSG